MVDSINQFPTIFLAGKLSHQIESWLLPRRSESVEVEELESPLPPSLGLLGQVVVIVVVAINGHH